jgi:hypothetical protein
MEMIIRQLQYFFVSFFCGILLMLLYDFILLLRRKIKHSLFGKWVEDWLFWTGAAIFVFQLIFDLNNGIMRSFFVVSFTMGMFAYRKIVGNRLVCALSALIHQILRPFVWIRKKIRKKP